MTSANSSKNVVLALGKGKCHGAVTHTFLGKAQTYSFACLGQVRYRPLEVLCADCFGVGGGGGGVGLDGGCAGVLEIVGRGVVDLVEVSRLILCHSIVGALQAALVAGPEVVEVETYAAAWASLNRRASDGEFLILAF
jgi:hypothetical protein